MPPDLNSLPPSPSPNLTPQSTHSSRSRGMASTNEPVRHHPHGNSTPPSLSPQTTSLAAAAALNAGLQNEERRPSAGSLRGNPSFQRRRSSVRMNLSLNDPALPAPGEMAMSPGYRSHGPNWSQSSSSPTRHARQPSLGELHQELESEQEAQVNRLLSMIRQQQSQIQALQSQVPASALNTTAIDDSNPPSDNSGAQTPAQSTNISRSNTQHQQRPSSISRHSSHRASSSARPSNSSDVSPSIRPHHNPHLPAPLPLASPPTLNTNVAGGADDSASPSLSSVSSALRDESAFYQAETQMLTRENQMLKLRIRELERQISEMGGPSAVVTYSPATHSSLHAGAGSEGGNTEGVNS